MQIDSTRVNVLVVLESIQGDSNDRLVKLNIDSFELRRLRLDLVYVYKIMFGLVAADISDYFTLQSVNAVSYTHLTLPTIYSV